MTGIYSSLILAPLKFVSGQIAARNGTPTSPTDLGSVINWLLANNNGVITRQSINSLLDANNPILNPNGPGSNSLVISPQLVPLLTSIRDHIVGSGISSDHPLCRGARNGQPVDHTHINALLPQTIAVAPPPNFEIDTNYVVPGSIRAQASLMIGSINVTYTGGRPSERLVIFVGNENPRRLHILRFRNDGFGESSSMMEDISFLPRDLTIPALTSNPPSSPANRLIRIFIDAMDIGGVSAGTGVEASRIVTVRNNPTAELPSNDRAFLQWFLAAIRSNLNNLTTLQSAQIRYFGGIGNQSAEGTAIGNIAGSVNINGLPQSIPEFQTYFDNAERLGTNVYLDERHTSSARSAIFRIQSSHPNAERIAQLIRIKVCVGGREEIRYRLIIKLTYTNNMHCFEEFEITQAALQRLALENLENNIDWNDINSVRNFIARRFRIDYDSTIALRNRQRGFIQFSELRRAGNNPEIRSRSSYYWNNSRWAWTHSTFAAAVGSMTSAPYAIQQGQTYCNLTWESSIPAPPPPSGTGSPPPTLSERNTSPATLSPDFARHAISRRQLFRQTGTSGIFIGRDRHADFEYPVYLLPGGHWLYVRPPSSRDSQAHSVQIFSRGATDWADIGHINNSGQFVPAPGVTLPATQATIQTGVTAITNYRAAPTPVAVRGVTLCPTTTSNIFMCAGDVDWDYPVYILPDGRLLYVRDTLQNNNGDVQIFNRGADRWTRVGQLTDAATTGDADIQTGIAAIRAFSGNNGLSTLTTAEARERYRRFEAQCQIPAINLRIRHANGAIGDNIFSQSTYYLMCVYASRCGMVNDTGFREELTRMIGNRPMERGSFNSTSWALNFVRQNCPVLVPANTLNPNEYYVHLIEELMCGTNGSYETTMITHLPTDPQSFSTYTPVSFRSARHLPVNNLIHIFTTDGRMNPAHAALINTRIQQFARLSKTNFYDGSNLWDHNYVQEIVRGIVTDPELGLTTERSREAMTRVLKRVFNAFKTWWTNKSTTDGYQRFSESELRTIAERGRAVR